MPNQFLSDEFGDIEDYFVTDYWLIDQFVGDSLWGWGRGLDGALGINNNTNRSTPVTTFAGGSNWKQVSAGYFYTAAIKTDGTLWTFGQGRSPFNQSTRTGNLGVNDNTNRPTPVTTFAGGTDWKQVSTGAHHTVAIKTDGSLWIWGANNQGQLGVNDGNNVPRLTPVTTFAGGNTWKSVSCGSFHTAAIKTDGSLWTWGYNDSGQLGINAFGSIPTPVTTFAGGTTWKSVSTGGYHTAAIKTDGSLWVWGSNNQGRLGINLGNVNINTPVTTFAGGNDWKQVSGGEGHTAAIKTDGSLWTWGLNGDGQLGTNDTTPNRSTPVTTFAGGNNWKQVSCGGAFSIAAIKTDGTLWTWGNNTFYGELGINDTIDRSTPVTTFAGGNNWKQVDVGSSQIAAIKSGLNVDLS